MAWVTPSSRSTGTLITSAIWNQDNVDNPTFLYNSPAARVYNTANISIPDVTETLLTFDSERFDTDGMHNPALNPGRLTCVTPGKYHIFANLQFATNGTGIRYLFLRLNGTTKIAAVRQAPDGTGAANSIAHAMHIQTVYALAATDYVELFVYQSSTAARNVEAQSNWSPEFGMAWLAA